MVLIQDVKISKDEIFGVSRLMNIRSRKGFTLTELVVTVAILAIIVIPISIIFNMVYSNIIIETDRITAQQSAREVLYGKGLNYFGIDDMGKYGILGELERSNATSGEVTIAGKSIIIPYNGEKRSYSFDSANNQLIYEQLNADGSKKVGLDPAIYFKDEKSANSKDIKVKDFTVEMKAKQSDTDSDIINITVKVECGKSGEITLTGSYRFPNIEK